MQRKTLREEWEKEKRRKKKKIIIKRTIGVLLIILIFAAFVAAICIKEGIKMGLLTCGAAFLTAAILYIATWLITAE